MSSSPLIDQTLAEILELDVEAMAAARARQDTLTKPLGSLGRLEDLSVQLAGIFGQGTPQIRRKSIILAAGDHGVVAEGVSAYPQDVTPAMVMNFLGGGAAINVLARHAGADIVILDAGVAADLPSHPLLRSVKIGRGTANMAQGPAMSRQQAVQCIETGIETAHEQIAEGADLVACGDMGIGNTTPSSAITSVITGIDPAVTTGRGTGIDDGVLDHKVGIIKRSIEVNQPNASDGLDVLSKVGGFEIGVLAGAMLGAASRRRPVVVDGLISGAAALIAWTMSPMAPPLLHRLSSVGGAGPPGRAGRHGPASPLGPGNAPGGGHRSGPGDAPHRCRGQMSRGNGHLRRGGGFRTNRRRFRR